MIKILADNGSTQKLFTYDELCDIFNFTPSCKNDIYRTQTAYAIYTVNVYKGNDGALGVVAESFKRRPNSRNYNMARPTQEGYSKGDTRPLIDGKYRNVESKIGGGRIDKIKDKYIIYTLIIDNSTGRKILEPRLLKTETFINKLYELNAVKDINKNHTFNGIGIQVSKRPLWHWLETIEPYDHTKAYSSDEIL